MLPKDKRLWSHVSIPKPLYDDLKLIAKLNDEDVHNMIMSGLNAHFRADLDKVQSWRPADKKRNKTKEKTE